MSIRKGVRDDKRLRRLTDDKSETDRKYRNLLRENNRLERELDAAFEIKAHRGIHKIKAREGRGDSEAMAVAIASDWHIEEEVKAGSVNYRNKFNLDIAKKRVDKFFERIVRMIRKEQQDVKIHELMLALLGDFVTGRLHEENLEVCLLRPMDAIMLAQDWIESGILFLLEHTDLKIVIPCTVGNHSRITRRVHHGTERGNSMEWFMYNNLAQRFADEPRIKFILGEGYLLYMNVYNQVIRLHHGHNVRYWGGVGGLTIPMNKAIGQWDLERQANLTLCGHFHQYIPMRRFVVNASLIGYSPFAIAIKGEYEPPSQSFFLIDKKRGKTVSIPLYL